jgi:hypothetical protein
MLKLKLLLPMYLLCTAITSKLYNVNEDQALTWCEIEFKAMLVIHDY